MTQRNTKFHLLRVALPEIDVQDNLLDTKLLVSLLTQTSLKSLSDIDIPKTNGCVRVTFDRLKWAAVQKGLMIHHVINKRNQMYFVCLVTLQKGKQSRESD